MRNFVLFVAAATLIGGSSLAIAQDRDNHGGPQGNAPHPGPAAAPHGGPAPHAAAHGGGAPAHTPPAHAPNAAPVHAQNNGQNNFHAPAPQRAQAAPAAAPAMRAAPNNANANAMRGNRGNNAQPTNNAMRGNANRGNAPQHNFSSARNFHQNFNASRRFHAAPYRQPNGFYVHHWTWGETLPPIFWARDYWLNDFGDYDLPPPPPGAVWVRVNADALLIDADSGEIIEVDYGVFY